MVVAQPNLRFGRAVVEKRKPFILATSQVGVALTVLLAFVLVGPPDRQPQDAPPNGNGSLAGLSEDALRAFRQSALIGTGQLENERASKAKDTLAALALPRPGSVVIPPRRQTKRHEPGAKHEKDPSGRDEEGAQTGIAGMNE